MADLTRGELNDLIAEFATKNPKYRDALMKNPKDVIERQLQSTLPSSMSVKVVQDTANSMTLVLPHVVKEGEELSDSALESVAGGFLDKYTCNFNKAGGIGTRIEIGI